jgi:hypothetical protein
MPVTAKMAIEFAGAPNSGNDRRGGRYFLRCHARGGARAEARRFQLEKSIEFGGLRLHRRRRCAAAQVPGLLVMASAH